MQEGRRHGPAVRHEEKQSAGEKRAGTSTTCRRPTGNQLMRCSNHADVIMAQAPLYLSLDASLSAPLTLHRLTNCGRRWHVHHTTVTESASACNSPSRHSFASRRSSAGTAR